MNILILGVIGFIGLYIVLKFVVEGYVVIGFGCDIVCFVVCIL